MAAMRKLQRSAKLEVQFGPTAIADQLRVHAKAVADIDLNSSILSALRLAQ
jgi:hypothetical protein